MKPKFLKTLAHKASRRLKRSTPTILTCLSAFGLVATTVSAVKATPKAMRLIEDAKQTDQYDLSKPENSLSDMEMLYSDCADRHLHFGLHFRS